MAAESRTAKSLKNSVVALGFYFVNLILQFFSRKIFLDHLGAEVLGLEGPLVENSMGHFLAVLASSAAASWALWLAWSRRPLKRSNKG